MSCFFVGTIYDPFRLVLPTLASKCTSTRKCTAARKEHAYWERCVYVCLYIYILYTHTRSRIEGVEGQVWGFRFLKHMDRTVVFWG